MKFFAIILFSFAAFANTASAQFSIRKIDQSNLSPIARSDSLIPAQIDASYYSRAQAHFERRERRRQRNTLEFTPGLQLTQTGFDNWAAGGDNTFTGKATIFFRHLYKVDRYSVENRLEARYGINRINGKSFKNEDEFRYSLVMSWKIRDAWSYAGTVGFRSQFTDGFKSRNDDTRVSTFMAPGYLDVSLGFSFRPDKSPLTVIISPIAGQFTFVLDSMLSAQARFGVEANQRVRKNAGPALKIDFDKRFGGKDKQVFRYRSNLYFFTNLGRTSQARWENTLDIRATKVLSTTLYGLFFYEEPLTTPLPKKIQSRYSLGLTLSYTIKNKK